MPLEFSELQAIDLSGRQPKQLIESPYVSLHSFQCRPADVSDMSVMRLFL